MTNGVTVFDATKFVFEYLGAGKITQIKLYKLLWFVQGWHFKSEDKSLFEENFVAWRLGPVPKDLWFHFRGKKFLFKEDFNIEDANSNKITGISKNIVEMVLDKYKDFSGSELIEMSHECTPWKEHRGRFGSDLVIPKNEIAEYFREL